VVVLLMWFYVSAYIVLAGPNSIPRSKRRGADNEFVAGHGLFGGVRIVICVV